MNDVMQTINAFNQFRQSFRGDPQQEVQRLIASGKISQQQLNAAQQQATQLMNAMRQMGIRI